MDFGLDFNKIQQIIDAHSIANPSVNLIVNPVANPIAVSLASSKAKDDTWLIRENTLYSDKNHNRYVPCPDVQRNSTACVDMTAGRTHRLDAHFHHKDFPDNNPLWTQGNRHRRHSVDVNTEDGNLPSIFQPLESPAKADGSEIARLPLNIKYVPIHPFNFRYVTQIPPSRGNECLQTNSAALSDKSFDIIQRVSHGFEGWFDDEIIDMSFDMLSRILDLPSHQIALASVAEATDLFNISHWIAASAQNPDLISSYTQDPQIFDTEMIKAFSNKDWLVLPINDGYPMEIINNSDSRARHSTLDKLDYEPGESFGSH
jgi:hypothetical protein